MSSLRKQIRALDREAERARRNPEDYETVELPGDEVVPGNNGGSEHRLAKVRVRVPRRVLDEAGRPARIVRKGGDQVVYRMGCEHEEARSASAARPTAWEWCRTCKDRGGPRYEDYYTRRCPSCNHTRGHRAHERVSGLKWCGRCGGLFGNCYLGDSYGVVKPRFCLPGDRGAEQRSVPFDMMCLGSKGEERRHGFFDPETGCITQTG